MHPILSLGKQLLAAEKPARYIGGEQGSIRKQGELFTIALCFPDLYEIGMSNNAMRILYSTLNSMDGIRCERVFAPARDFESILRETKMPLLTLESGIPLKNVDLLAFTIGYELSATNILNVLDLGGISMDASSRSEEEPVVIAGGPAVTNPHPLSRFMDAVWIGEAEAGFFSLAADLAGIRKAGAPRAAILERLRGESAFWMKGKKAVRAIDMDFSERTYEFSFPWPSIKPVQDHGTVEIMRGCPNGCRFCHAGYFYRPQRVRSPEKIFHEIENLVTKQGYREITLASLSSGDYPELPALVRELNHRWASRRISFQLPSLKVESFSLPVLGELSHTRKSGLTFAVETPEEAWQRSINKTVSLDKILAILGEAKSKGYRLAKFYFMIGLPIPDSSKSEAESLVDFLRKLLSECSFQLNVNIGTFIPKPHTPYQWCAQISEEEAFSRISFIRDAFRSERRLKISYHSPFTSLLEGLVSRGDERVGDLLRKAWERGARLDAWEDLLLRDVWRQVLAEAPKGLLEEALGPRNLESELPWDDVSLRIGKRYLRTEYEKSQTSVVTGACKDSCKDFCGTCNDSDIFVYNTINSITHQTDEAATPFSAAQPVETSRPTHRMVVRFQKIGSAAYLPHHSILDALYRALQLSRIPVSFSEGFNPLPRLEIEDPIPLGMESLDDYFSILLLEPIDPISALNQFTRHLPEGFNLIKTALYPILAGKKNRSLSSLSWGSEYLIGTSDKEVLPIFQTLLEDPRLHGSCIVEEPETEGTVIRLRLRSGGSKEIGFGSLFEKAFGSSYSKSPVLVQRMMQWADIGTGPILFFDALETLYNSPLAAAGDSVKT